MTDYAHTNRRRLIIVVRADPIICGHSTEARNLCEAAKREGYDEIHIVTWPLDHLQGSGLPLKPLDSIPSYGRNVTVHRPGPVGDYKVLDGRFLHGMTGTIVDLLTTGKPAHNTVMDLYLVPHGRVVIDAVRTAKEIYQRTNCAQEIVTIGEAVGSDITNVVRNAADDGKYGNAAVVLDTYLAHDRPVAVSEYTKELIVDAAAQVDKKLGTDFAKECRSRVDISYPAIDADWYTSIGHEKHSTIQTLRARGLEFGQYILFLSRLVRAKGVDDLINGYKRSKMYGEMPLVICGVGPALEGLQNLAAGDPNIIFLTDVTDREKGRLMHCCAAYALPSKPCPEFVETFGIAIAEKMLAGGPGPVITTTTGGIPEATGDECMYVRAGDAVDIARALDEVANTPRGQLTQRSNRAQAFARRFDRSEVLRNLTQPLALRRTA